MRTKAFLRSEDGSASVFIAMILVVFIACFALLLRSARDEEGKAVAHIREREASISFFASFDRDLLENFGIFGRNVCGQSDGLSSGYVRGILAGYLRDYETSRDNGAGVCLDGLSVTGCTLITDEGGSPFRYQAERISEKKSTEKERKELFERANEAKEKITGAKKAVNDRIDELSLRSREAAEREIGNIISPLPEGDGEEEDRERGRGFGVKHVIPFAGDDDERAKLIWYAFHVFESYGEDGRELCLLERLATGEGDAKKAVEKVTEDIFAGCLSESGVFEEELSEEEQMIRAVNAAKETGNIIKGAATFRGYSYHEILAGYLAERDPEELTEDIMRCAETKMRESGRRHFALDHYAVFIETETVFRLPSGEGYNVVTERGYDDLK